MFSPLCSKPKMLDWANLIGSPADSKNGEKRAENAKIGPKCPSLSHEKGPVSQPGWDRSNPVTTRLTADLTHSVPTVPVKKQGRGNQEGKEGGDTGGAAGKPQDFCADVGKDQSTTYPAHPAAVLLLMAWARLKQIAGDERAELLLDLEALPPADQIRHWHGVCLKEGLKPWKVLCLPASLSGADCTRCRNLCTRHEAIGNDRVQYHWACRLGYLILEHGRGTERIWIAPPECKSFDRWYPSDWR